jgi:organic hydroperoxide reductase OsmC/OhrA
LAAVAGCFTTTLRSISGSAHFDFTDLQVEAYGVVSKAQPGYGFSEIVVSPTLQITASTEREYALDLLKKAEKLCLVSRAIDVPLRFEPKIEVQLSV